MASSQLPLIEAAKAGNIPEIQRLLASGVNVNAVDAENKSALYHAIIQSKEAAALELLRTPGINIRLRPIVIMKYIEEGEEITVELSGKTILGAAVSKNMTTVVRYLFTHFPKSDIQCNVREEGGVGDFPIIEALGTYWYSFPIIKLLVENCPEILGSATENVRNLMGGKENVRLYNPIQYAKKVLDDELDAFKRLGNINKEKRERGEEPTADEIGMYNYQKYKIDKLGDIIAYLQSKAPSRAVAAPAGAAGASNAKNTRRRASRRNRKSRRNRNQNKKY